MIRLLFASAALAAVLGPGACSKLLGKSGDDTADSGAAVASAAPSASASAVASASAEPAPTTSTAAAANAPLAISGACVDPKKDAARYVTSGAKSTEDDWDLDGDGKPDKAIHFDLGGVENPTRLYVMRGTCGINVGSYTGASAKLSGMKSHGLKSISVLAKDAACTQDCGCKDKEIEFFYNGKTYQVGARKEIPRECKTGPAASASGKPAPGAVSGKFKVGQHLWTVATKGNSFEVIVVGYTAPGKVRVRYVGSKDEDTIDEDMLFTTPQS